MKSYSFFASCYQKSPSTKLVSKKTTQSETHGLNIGEQSVLGDSCLRSYALKAASQGDYSKAIAILNQLINRHPHNAIDYNNRGLIYFQCGELQKAFCDYNTALKLDPRLASAYNNRGNYYAACGKLDSALADYDQALDLNPSYVRAWINRGITLRDLGQYEEAIDNFDIALLFGQLEGHILAERGRTYHLWGDWNFAIADYRRALTQLPLPNPKKEDPSCRLRLRVENWLNDLLCYPS
ncbi:tetratricopeptide repeat protein [Aetokthonos hydrillicola Thurmond2011]|jgi:tetratricopeptide (TPR) repeat protein|uniref:Tetratricopeptide repeat protein n=1 Tax=Aetokthonos hydrillicola Thurmond2011 TaxID=2712845 RepID=A0AAP5M9H6_9CYAN|nr:tetratricopeptide repeat protein [Aetokthonos hydrillicola]MBO3457182.1 tetratricopeptide repeat protein [Aetokthonos hydrillicola CCALA 1050]MBW4587533.1 tetratricopeptide repeat protein [Aetokthonos hydrillicola CCALA 1050]MDR9900201.1 tetratricopeptide repeat protein [Aetokthonos hydrillicola Thurmond2011]